MKTKLFICVSIFICLVSISFVSAEPSYLFKQNSFVDLKVPCYTTNYTPCVSTTTCNITILYPNSTALVDQGVMTWNSNYFNYTINKGISACGKYPVTVSCEGVYNGFSTFSFKVTPSGVTQNSILENPVLIFLVLFGILFIIFGINLEIPAIGFIGSILFLLSGIYLMIYGFNDVVNMYTRGLAISMIGMGMFFMFVSSYEWMNFGAGGED